VDIALNGLLVFPGVAANDHMDEGFTEKTILPIGEALTKLKTSHLRPLLGHNLAAGRAIGAVALAVQFMTGGEPTPKDLRKPASDPRREVRQAMASALLAARPGNPEKLFALGMPWLMDAAPKPRYTALIFMPALAESHGTRLVTLLGPLGSDPDREVRGALVNALNELGRSGLAEPVLELLEIWAGANRPNAWVISHVLSASWVADYPEQAKVILRVLSSKSGTTSQVKSAVEALTRHGLVIDL
jgi:hypothetical protein